MLHGYVAAWWTNWDVLLLLCEFALNFTKSALMGYSPTYIVLGRELVMPLEPAVRAVTDCYL